MAHQSLDHEEILNVRWATADPNPMAQKREARRVEEQAAEAIRRALPAEYIAEMEGKADGRKRRRLDGSHDSEGPRGGEVQAGLESGKRLMLERAGPRIEIEEQINGLGEMPDQQDQQQQDGGGSEEGWIFSRKTLAALHAARVTVASKSEAARTGPLVAYGSDDSD